MRITLSNLHKMMRDGQKISMLTCYDASFAALLDTAGVETLLIGDSLGNVLQGHESTLPVSLRDIVYHTACVARGAKNAFIIGDMPFGTFQVSPQDAFRNAAEIMAAGAQMVKIADARNHRLPDRARHSGVWSPRPHAAVSTSTRRLQGAGQDRQ
jgi:3-methyl-2-oxobutanoate hydroxymethyltransferase